MELNVSSTLNLDAQSVVTGRGCIIGQSGSGKSYLVGVIVEELCRNGLPFMIIDTEGEYRSLKGNYKVLWMGKEKEADADLDVDYGRLFTTALENSLSIIFDVSEVMNRQEYVEKALNALYAIEERQRSPFLVIIEEADKFAPQIVKSKMSIIEELSVRGRKRGIGLLVATQRPASISKNVLAQCSYGFIGKLSIENDLNAVSALLENRKRLKEIPGLSTGFFLPFGLQSSEPIKVNERVVQHVGSTPELRAPQKAQEIASIVKELGKESSQEEFVDAESEFKSARNLVSIKAVETRFTIDDAKERARNILKKKFLIFGPATEELEDLEAKYLRTDLYKIRIPSGMSNEYEEYFVIMKGNEFVTINKNVSIEKPEIEKPIKLSRIESEVLRLISEKGKANINFVIKKSGRTSQELRKIITKMKKARLVEQREDLLFARNYAKYLLKAKPAITSGKVMFGSLLNYQKEKRKGKEIMLSNVFPGAKVIGREDLYVPIYNMTLRHGNKVREFVLEGVGGKELSLESMD